jgi:hypothetical protein
MDSRAQVCNICVNKNVRSTNVDVSSLNFPWIYSIEMFIQLLDV